MALAPVNSVSSFVFCSRRGGAGTTRRALDAMELLAAQDSSLAVVGIDMSSNRSLTEQVLDGAATEVELEVDGTKAVVDADIATWLDFAGSNIQVPITGFFRPTRGGDRDNQFIVPGSTRLDQLAAEAHAQPVRYPFWDISVRRLVTKLASALVAGRFSALVVVIDLGCTALPCLWRAALHGANSAFGCSRKSDRLTQDFVDGLAASVPKIAFTIPFRMARPLILLHDDEKADRTCVLLSLSFPRLAAELKAAVSHCRTKVVVSDDEDPPAKRPRAVERVE